MKYLGARIPFAHAMYLYHECNALSFIPNKDDYETLHCVATQNAHATGSNSQPCL